MFMEYIKSQIKGILKRIMKKTTEYYCKCRKQFCIYLVYRFPFVIQVRLVYYSIDMKKHLLHLLAQLYISCDSYVLKEKLFQGWFVYLGFSCMCVCVWCLFVYFGHIKFTNICIADVTDIQQIVLFLKNNTIH